ncbi:uncharacterized protein LOC116259827 isoform X2 [Nymphaea colorata]|nr:uncharacterized protein LOC116259827 isoform X2 [Nymphaea colorata]
MGLNKTEINLRRLLRFAPKQQNPSKLVHYVATSRELLEQLKKDSASDGLPSISKANLNEYSERIEALAATLASMRPNDLVQADVHGLKDSGDIQPEETLPRPEPSQMNKPSSQTLRRRYLSNSEGDAKVSDKRDNNSSAKLDSYAQEHIEKHRKLQEDLTDEMVVLARQLKESSLLMSQSVKETEKILDSTEKAVEHSLASTGHANTRAMEVYSRSFNTTCFTWLLIFVMSCVFVMVVLLIRVT